MQKKRMRLFAISSMAVFLFGIFLTLKPHDSQAWARGKWMNVYGGNSTPSYQECASALANRCITGDIRSLPEKQLAP
ncbi:hypothetical protein [Marivirga harenae]|uniref:hypothetical protein n=1 Tax=Marivirga harenae TaxID=2010992 RepID=UPI0026DFE3B6|nr:hypothetical protein [Marivirga harenae]WKV10768.1 hypothetical protein Q3Y49_11145 [Marivirga harenae]